MLIYFLTRFYCYNHIFIDKDKFIADGILLQYTSTVTKSWAYKLRCENNITSMPVETKLISVCFN